MRSLAVSGIPDAAGLVYHHTGYATADWITFARGPYVGVVYGTRSARALAPSLARQQYERLR
jgi:hypothetical protein